MREPVLQSALSVFTPFAAYLPAELAHVSGVLAVVTCGLIFSQVGPRMIGPAARLQAISFWEVTTFLLNGALFVMVGMQLPAAIRGLSSISPLRALETAAVVSVVVIGGRLLWFYTVPYLIRMVDRRPRQRSRRVGARHRLPLAWAGMRGAVSLAAALAVPAVMADGRPMANRDATVFITVIVILVTLVALGPTLPAVVRWARLPADTAEADEEEMAIRHIARTALDALPAHAERLGVSDTEADEVAAELRVHAEFAADEDDTAEEERFGRTALFQALLGVKRAALVRLRDEGRIDDIVLRRVQELLDVEEVRLRVHPAHGRVTAEDRPTGT
jgi:Na+/H+ antiporter